MSKNRSSRRPTPYDHLRGSPQWNVVSKALSALVRNQDLQLTEDRSYIIGYFCKKLAEMKKSK